MPNLTNYKVKGRWAVRPAEPHEHSHAEYRRRVANEFPFCRDCWILSRRYFRVYNGACADCGSYAHTDCGTEFYTSRRGSRPKNGLPVNEDHPKS